MPVPGKNPAEPDFQDDVGLTTGLLTLKGIETPRGAPANTFGQPPYRIGEPGQTNWMLIVGGGTQSKIIPGSTGLTIRNNLDTQDNFVVQNSGQASFTNMAVNGGGLSLGGPLGTANSANEVIGVYTGIANNSATATMTISIPNQACAASLELTFLVALGAGGTYGQYEGILTSKGLVAIERLAAGTAAVSGPSANTITQAQSVQGTTASGQTITLTAATSAISGTASAVNTFTINLTIARSGAGSTNHLATIYARLINMVGGGCSITT